jgi:hypothetical protein
MTAVGMTVTIAATDVATTVIGMMID